MSLAHYPWTLRRERRTAELTRIPRWLSLASFELESTHEAALPALIRLQQGFPADAVTVAAIAVDDPAKARSYLEKRVWT